MPLLRSFCCGRPRMFSSCTVTLPAWLNALAVERGVNFSQTLQSALREQLHA